MESHTRFLANAKRKIHDRACSQVVSNLASIPPVLPYRIYRQMAMTKMGFAIQNT